MSLQDFKMKSLKDKIAEQGVPEEVKEKPTKKVTRKKKK